MQRRDAKGRFINDNQWAILYALADLPVPKRVGSRNATAPGTLEDIAAAAVAGTKIRGVGTVQDRPTRRTTRGVLVQEPFADVAPKPKPTPRKRKQTAAQKKAAQRTAAHAKAKADAARTAAEAQARKDAEAEAEAKTKAAKENEHLFPAGQEFELTIKYKAADHATLHVKIRVRLTMAMIDDQAFALTRRALASGIVPTGIDVAAIDWERGKGSGGYDNPDHDVLRDFGRLVNAGGATLRFAAVSSEEDV